MIRGGVAAEAAVQRVAGELHDRMRRISDPYLRERLADIEDLAGRLLSTLLGHGAAGADVPQGAILLARRLGPAELLDWHSRGIAGVAIEEASPDKPRRHPRPRAGHSHASVARAAYWTPRNRATTRWWTPTRASSCCAPRWRCVTPMPARWRPGRAQHAGWAVLRDQPGVTADGSR